MGGGRWGVTLTYKVATRQQLPSAFYESFRLAERPFKRGLMRGQKIASAARLIPAGVAWGFILRFGQKSLAWPTYIWCAQPTQGASTLVGGEITLGRTRQTSGDRERGRRPWRPSAGGESRSAGVWCRVPVETAAPGLGSPAMARRRPWTPPRGMRRAGPGAPGVGVRGSGPTAMACICGRGIATGWCLVPRAGGDRRARIGSADAGATLAAVSPSGPESFRAGRARRRETRWYPPPGASTWVRASCVAGVSCLMPLFMAADCLW